MAADENNIFSRWSSKPCVKSYLVVKPVEVAKVSVELVFRVLAAEMQRHGHSVLYWQDHERAYRLWPHAVPLAL